MFLTLQDALQSQAVDGAAQAVQEDLNPAEVSAKLRLGCELNKFQHCGLVLAGCYDAVLCYSMPIVCYDAILCYGAMWLGI